jgi:hypothetical protein
VADRDPKTGRVLRGNRLGARLSPTSPWLPEEQRLRARLIGALVRHAKVSTRSAEQRASRTLLALRLVAASESLTGAALVAAWKSVRDAHDTIERTFTAAKCDQRGRAPRKRAASRPAAATSSADWTLVQRHLTPPTGAKA